MFVTVTSGPFCLTLKEMGNDKPTPSVSGVDKTAVPSYVACNIGPLGSGGIISTADQDQGRKDQGPHGSPHSRVTDVVRLRPLGVVRLPPRRTGSFRNLNR